MTTGSLLTDRLTGTWAQEPLGSGAAHFRFPKALKGFIIVFTLLPDLGAERVVTDTVLDDIEHAVA